MKVSDGKHTRMTTIRPVSIYQIQAASCQNRLQFLIQTCEDSNQSWEHSRMIRELTVHTKNSLFLRPYFFKYLVYGFFSQNIKVRGGKTSSPKGNDAHLRAIIQS